MHQLVIRKEQLCNLYESGIFTNKTTIIFDSQYMLTNPISIMARKKTIITYLL